MKKGLSLILIFFSLSLAFSGQADKIVVIRSGAVVSKPTTQPSRVAMASPSLKSWKPVLLSNIEKMALLKRAGLTKYKTISSTASRLTVKEPYVESGAYLHFYRAKMIFTSYMADGAAILGNSSRFFGEDDQAPAVEIYFPVEGGQTYLVDCQVMHPDATYRITVYPSESSPNFTVENPVGGHILFLYQREARTRGGVGILITGQCRSGEEWVFKSIEISTID